MFKIKQGIRASKVVQGALEDSLNELAKIMVV